MARTWLITGSSRGLGREIAQAVLDQGDSAVATARRPWMLDYLVERYGGRVRAVALDVTDPAAARKAVQVAVDEFGRLDVLANIAGFHKMRHTPTMTDEEWDRDLAVNLNGPFYLCRAALPHLLATGGNIVNVSSIAGVSDSVRSPPRLRITSSACA